jgi:16S rRNA processing protein RimM
VESPATVEQPQRVVIAEIFREWGIRGEVTARSQTDVPGRLENLKTAWVQLADGTDLAVTIEAARPHKSDWVLKFAGVDSMTDAERFRGADLWVSREERAPLPEGEYYETDLVGCRVRVLKTGSPIGRVTGMQRFGGPPLLEVVTGTDGGGREVLIPFVPSICPKVDLEAREIGVDLPEGLLDL